jgi:hypothetical protein
MGTDEVLGCLVTMPRFQERQSLRNLFMSESTPLQTKREVCKKLPHHPDPCMGHIVDGGED